MPPPPPPQQQQQMGQQQQQMGQQQQQQQMGQQQMGQQQMGGMPQNTNQQFGTVNAGGAGATPGADRGPLLVSLPVQVLDNGKLRVEQVPL